MQNLISYDKRGSYCSFSSHTFAQETANTLSEVLKSVFNGTMEINVYTPPYDSSTTPDGFIRICFWNDQKDYKQIGIGFGQSEIEKEFRTQFNREQWLKYPDDPHTSGIFASNFDEAWRIVCILGEILKVKEVRLSYGN